MTMENALKIRTCFLLALLFLTACAPVSAPAASTLTPAAPTSMPPSPTPIPSPTVPPLDLAAIESGTYTLSALDNLKVTLAGGKVEVVNPPDNLKVTGRLIEPVAFGDLNGDGVDDAAFTIAVNTGGSGTFHIMIAVLARTNQVASQQVGDRIQEKQLSIQNAKIVLEYLRAGPRDGLCCPSEHAMTTYQFHQGDLLKIDDKVIP